ncbi:MAG: serine/threonine protein kinase, partial [Myxococcota bacterium]|nr:serine/threonine protein kinase [Myxococcota bacterium]
MGGDPDEGLGAPPVGDALELAVARTRIESALFAATETVTLGRYHLLEKVGAGGMGVVWGAWDPELDRRVAIKLVKAERRAARDRILLEGQALAKLSHPNVVAVHDVGVIGDQVYIVMEWVRGKDLRAYCQQPHTVRELLSIYRAAADGLSAAHRAGLVHRDFKPDNAILGDDGRVRVLDFGLARGEVHAEPASDPGVAELRSPAERPGSAALTRGVGTPRYMPPEQAEGKVLTHAADQYALCTSLAEALRGRTADGKPAPIPAWIDAILQRGTAPDPARRFASMDELGRALARDPASLWRRRALVIAAAGAAGGAFLIGSARSTATHVEPCGGGAAELATTWNEQVRSRLVAHLDGLGPYGVAEAPRLIPVIEGYGTRWAGAHRAACMAQERRELTPQLYERNLRCLERSRTSYQTVLDVLTTVPAERLPDAAIALQALPEVERCLTETRTSTVAPPARAIAADVARLDGAIEQARVRTLAADPGAPAELAGLAAEAERLAYAPLVARAFLTYGFALSRTGKMAEAIPHLDRAVAAALEAGDDVAFVEAYARQVYATAVTTEAERPAELADPLASVRLAERIAARLHGPFGAFVRPLLFNNIGIAHNARQDPAGAATWFSRAHDEWQTTRDPSVELMFIPINLALVTGDRARQQQLMDEAAPRFDAALGPLHPSAIEFRTRAAIILPHPGLATQRLGEACDAFRRLHPHLTTKIAYCAYELG